jgi:TolB protein
MNNTNFYFFKFLFSIYLGSLLIIISGDEVASKTLKIEVANGVIEPLPIAIPKFINSGNLNELAKNIAAVVADDLEGTGLFRSISLETKISEPINFDSPVQFSDWKSMNAKVLILGSVEVSGANQISVKFRLFDVFSQVPIQAGLKFSGPEKGWRRIAHKVADEVYSRITNERKYFDSRVAFVAEEGPKNNRQKRLVVMDYDGADQTFLTKKGGALVLAPSFSPDGTKLLFTSYESGLPRIYLLDIGSRKTVLLHEELGTMSFSPRFSPDGRDVVYSLFKDSNTDIYKLNIASNYTSRLTSSMAIDTAPSFSPDGKMVVFESDRSGSQQLYLIASSGGDAKRISFGKGRYGSPVWSPSGDLIAFTKQNNGRFHIGIMRADGSQESLLTASFLDDGATWAPNGRVVMFTRTTPGSGGSSTLYSVDITGRNLKPVRANSSDPTWSNLLN